MADAADDLLFDGDVYIYRGGQVPGHLRERITRARVDEAVKIIDERAFLNCTNLLDVETHDGITKIKRGAFDRCLSLKKIKLPGVREIEKAAFQYCYNLTDVEFGEDLERIGRLVFNICRSLRRIAVPLKVLSFLQNQFGSCHNLATVDLIGGIHKTISSLHMEWWRDDVKEEINRINRVLPRTGGRGVAIDSWIVIVIRRIERYKTLHNTLLKEATTLLELALWKAKLDGDKSEDNPLKVKTKEVKIDIDCARQERRITCGASIIIKNVLPFLQLA